MKWLKSLLQPNRKSDAALTADDVRDKFIELRKSIGIGGVGAVTAGEVRNVLMRMAVKDVGDADTVRQMLVQGADKEGWDEKGYTLLHHAAIRGLTSIVELLVQAGADKEAKTSDGNGMTPLLVAALAGQASVVEMLVRAGSNKEAIDTQLGKTPTWWAAQRGHSDVVAILMSTMAPGYSPPTNPATDGGLQPQTENLHRWEWSGFPQQLVDGHYGQWSHSEWVELLERLKQTEFWPMERTR